MNKEKKAGQWGTGSKVPTIQKLHRTGRTNVKIKINKAAAKALRRQDPNFLKSFCERVTIALEAR